MLPAQYPIAPPAVPREEQKPRQAFITKRLQERLRGLLKSKRIYAAAAAAAVLSVCLSLGVTLTRRPWCDEAWFASPAYNLITNHTLAMTILDPHGFAFLPLVKGLDRYTFWVLPGYLLTVAAWFKAFGVGIVSMRLLSILWSMVALLSWLVIVEKLTKSRFLAVGTVIVLALDHNFVLTAATGRMDMMCAALGFAGIAAYLFFREQDLRMAIWTSQCLLAVAAFTHPNAVLALATLMLFAGPFDWRRLRPRHFLQALVPYLVCAVAWSFYILKDPALFVDQFGVQFNMADRFILPPNPLDAISAEIMLRYAGPFGLKPELHLPFLSWILLSYVAAIAAAVSIPSLRRRRGVKPLLLATGLTFFLMIFLRKAEYYLIYIVPFYTALLVIWLQWCWKRRFVPNWAVAMVVFVLVGTHVGSSLMRIRHDPYHRRFLQATNYLKAHMRPHDLVIGSGELAFELGFDGQVLDDSRLGELSGRKADFIVIEFQYSAFWFSMFKALEPDTYDYVTKLLDEDYELVYDQSKAGYQDTGGYTAAYRIYAHIDHSGRVPSRASSGLTAPRSRG